MFTDIDRDYDTSLSLNTTPEKGESCDTPDKTVKAAQHVPNLLAFLDQDDEQWSQRVQRTAVYSTKYAPSSAEQAEIHQVEGLYGIEHRKNSSIFTGMFRSTTRAGGLSVPTDAETQQWNAVVHPARLLPPDSTEPKKPGSILLKRGQCLLVQQSSAKDASSGSGDEEDDVKECEVLLMTHGLIIGIMGEQPPVDVTAGSTEERPVILRELDRAIEWDHIEYISPTTTALSKLAWCIDLVPSSDNGNKKPSCRQITLVCTMQSELTHWFEGLHTAVVRHHMHAPGPISSGPRSMLGWEYHQVHISAFTLAVTNRDADQSEHALTKDDANLNRIDEYNEYAPIHYAVKLNNGPALQALLEAGADPNLPDGMGHTPMWHAVMDDLSPSLCQILQQGGAKPMSKKQIEKEKKGELFGKVAATQAILDDRHRQEEQKKDAEKAAIEMKNNMKLMQQRGEQINEIGDKASNLNQQAQEYGSLAKALKEKTMKKKWYHL